MMEILFIESIKNKSTVPKKIAFNRNDNGYIES